MQHDDDIPTPEPTTALPGSVRKVDVLAERYARGQSLWHPDDARPPEWESRPGPTGRRKFHPPAGIPFR